MKYNYLANTIDSDTLYLSRKASQRLRQANVTHMISDI